MAEDKNKLLIQIEAQLQELKKGLKEAQGEVDNFASGTEKAGDKLDDVEDSGKKAGKAIGKSGLGKDAKNAATDLGKTAQATEDLQRGLKDLAGGNVGGIADVSSGLKNFSSVLGSSMIATAAAAAGLLAIGAAAFFALKHFEDKRQALLNLELQYSLLTKRVKDYEESLWGIEKAQVDALKGSAKELTTLKLLKAQVENTNLSEKQRLLALNELRKIYPGYLKDMTDEKALVGGLSGVYETLTTAILKKAKTQAASSLIAENEMKILILRTKQEKTALEYVQLRAEQLAAEKTAIEAISENRSGADRAQSHALAVQKEANKKLEENQQTGADIVTLQKDSLKLANQIAAGGGLLPITPGEGTDDIDDFTSKITNFKNSLTGEFSLNVPSFEEFVTGSETLTQFGKALDATTIKGSEFNKISQDLIANAPEWSKMLPDPEEMEIQVEHIGVALSRVEQQMMTFGDSMANLISGTIANTFTDLGVSIGEALANGESVIGAIGGSLISSFGAFLGELGKMLISYGSLAVAKGLIDLALKSKNPIVTIAAGAAAIVVGVALTAVGSAISTRASAGLGSGGGGSSAGSTAGSGSASSYSGSRASGSSGSTGGGTYVFEIEGTKLVGVLSRTLNRNKALGGSLSIG